MSKGEKRFEEIKERYKKAYFDCHDKSIEVLYKNGFIIVGNYFGEGATRIRIKQFEKMIETLEKRVLDKSL